DADVAAAHDAVSQAKANLAAANSGENQNAMRVADRENTKHAAAQARAQLEQAHSNLRQRSIHDQAVREAEGALKVAQHQLEYQRTQLSRSVIRTHISGTVVSIAAQQGETVAAAFATPTLIIVTDLNRLEVKAYVDETDVGRLHVGLPAEVKV